ncbi:hypothetical protein GS421_10940 [Rhodococcus hoagii]|nr:hypothetical protein [Prescottella equi]
MNVGDRARAMAVFDGSVRHLEPETLAEALADSAVTSTTPPSVERSVFMDIYAAVARAHMR